MVFGKSTSVSALEARRVNLYNSFGAFISTMEISLDLGDIDYILTGDVSAQNIDITANNIINQGHVIALDFIKLNATGNSGIAGSGNITNGFANGDNSNVLLASGTYLNLIAKNNIDNYATILGTTDTTLTATYGNINNYNNGIISAGYQTATLNTLNGSFNNAKENSIFTSDNNAILNVKNLNNFGEISIANDLITNITNNLTNNPKALIWIGNNAIFNVANNFLNNQADIYAERNLTIQKNYSQDPTQNKTNLVQNISGSIETFAGDINIKAVTLENKRSSMKSQGADYVYGQAYVRGGDCHRSRWGKLKCNPIIYRDLHAANINGIAGLEASVLSGGGINIASNSLLNDASSIISSSNLEINTSIFKNISYNLVEYNDNSSRSESYPALIKSGGALTITQNGFPNSSLINGSDVAQYSSFAGNSKKSKLTKINKIDVYQLGETGVLEVDLSSIISAINDKITSNSKAKISQLDANIEGSQLNNSDSNLAFLGNFKINFDPSSISPLIESRSQFRDVSKFFGSSYYFEQLGMDSSAILADINRQNRTGNIRMLGDSFVESKLIIDQLKKLTNDSLLLSQTTTDQNQQIKELLDNAINEFSALGLNAKDVAIKGLTKNQANSLTKDIVTFELTSINGINVLVPKIYLSQDTRNRILNPNSLVSGTALANSSLANSSLANSSTIFAKENLTIDSPNASLINNGAIVSGGDLAMNIASLTNKTNSMAQAQIIGKNNLSITAQNGDIKNIGAKIEALGNLSLEALKGNILNTAIVQTNDQNLLNQNPDSYQLGFNNIGKFSGNITSTLLQNASLKGGSISISASNDFTNLGAEISATKNILPNENILPDGSIATNPNTTSGNISITAGDDINISTLQLRNREESSWGNRKKGGTLVIDQTKNIGSNIESAGSLSLMTTGLGVDSSINSINADPKSDINIIGSNLSTTSTGSNITINANDSLNIASAIDSSYKMETFNKKGMTVKKSSIDINSSTTNISSNINSLGDISITSGDDTNIIASNLKGVNGNILVGKHIDQDPLSATYGQEIINNLAQITIKSGQNYHYKYHQSTKIKTDSTAVAVGAIAAVAVTMATGGAALAVAGAAFGGAATGAGAKKGKTTTNETTEIMQVSSNLNFTNNLNIQSASNIDITASNLTAENATILAGKFRDEGIDIVTNNDAKLMINSAFNILQINTTVKKVKPNYVGIAAVAGGSALIGQAIGNYLTSSVSNVGPIIPITSVAVVSGVGAGYAGISGALGINPDNKSIFDPLINLRSSSKSSSTFNSEINSNLNFNSLTTQ